VLFIGAERADTNTSRAALANRYHGEISKQKFYLAIPDSTFLSVAQNSQEAAIVYSKFVN